MHFFGTDLCQHADAFGKPYEGGHQYRIPVIDIAAVDVFLTVFMAYIFSKLFGSNFLNITVFFFITAFVLHWAFCVPTALNMKVLGDYWNSSQNVFFPMW